MESKPYIAHALVVAPNLLLLATAVHGLRLKPIGREKRKIYADRIVFRHRRRWHDLSPGALSPNATVFVCISVIVIVAVGRRSFSYMASIEEADQLDSGMGSSDAHSPEVKSLLPDDDDDDEEDESLAERLLGLTEMFPEEVRNFGYNVGSCLYSCTKGLYGFSCSAAWLFFSSSAILFAPVLFEIERAQMEEAQRSQQKQVLLGPSTQTSTASSLPMAPPVQR